MKTVNLDVEEINSSFFAIEDIEGENDIDDNDEITSKILSVDTNTMDIMLPEDLIVFNLIPIDDNKHPGFMNIPDLEKGDIFFFISSQSNISENERLKINLQEINDGAKETEFDEFAIFKVKSISKINFKKKNKPYMPKDNITYYKLSLYDGNVLNIISRFGYKKVPRDIINRIKKIDKRENKCTKNDFFYLLRKE